MDFKQSILISLVIILSSNSNAQQNHWGAWQPNECWRGLQYRLRNNGVSNGKFEWDVQFKNIYDVSISYSFRLGTTAELQELRDGSRRTDKRNTHLLPGTSTPGDIGATFQLVSSATDCGVYVDRVHFGDDDAATYAKCGSQKNEDESKKTTSFTASADPASISIDRNSTDERVVFTQVQNNTKIKSVSTQSQNTAALQQLQQSNDYLVNNLKSASDGNPYANNNITENAGLLAGSLFQLFKKTDYSAYKPVNVTETLADYVTTNGDIPSTTISALTYLQNYAGTHTLEDDWHVTEIDSIYIKDSVMVIWTNNEVFKNKRHKDKNKIWLQFTQINYINLLQTKISVKKNTFSYQDNGVFRAHDAVYYNYFLVPFSSEPSIGRVRTVQEHNKVKDKVLNFEDLEKGHHMNILDNFSLQEFMWFKGNDAIDVANAFCKIFADFRSNSIVMKK